MNLPSNTNTGCIKIEFINLKKELLKLYKLKIKTIDKIEELNEKIEKCFKNDVIVEEIGNLGRTIGVNETYLENLGKKETELNQKLKNIFYIFCSKKNFEINEEFVQGLGLDEFYRDECAEAICYEEAKDYAKVKNQYELLERIAKEEASTWKNIGADMDDDDFRKVIIYLSSFYDGKSKEFSKKAYIARCQNNISKEYAHLVNAINDLAKCYMEGYGVPQDFFKAVQLYIQASEKGNSFSMYQLGKCYFKGLGIEKNLTEAFKWFLCAAREGNKDKDIFSMLKQYYENDWGKNIFLEEDKEGYISYLLGNFYLNSDWKKALDFLSNAANLGSIEAMSQLANYYLLGKEPLSKDYCKAFSLYSLAAEKGDPISMQQLGKCYLEGLGVEKNFTEAFRWLTSAISSQQAAKQRFDESMKALGRLYNEGANNSIKNDIKQFAVFFLEKANKEPSEVLYRQALYFEYGIGIAKDISEASILYWEASQKGHQEARRKLKHLEKTFEQEVDKLYMTGCSYLHGIEVIEDHRIAAMYFLEAAQKGNSPAMYQLAYLYEKGDGMPKDDEEAIKWFKEAAKKKYPDAVRKLKSLNMSF